MNPYDVRRLAQVWALVARLEAMKVENLIRARNNEAPHYGEQDFTMLQNNFEDVANCPDELL